jgi:hypothetical protein
MTFESYAKDKRKHRVAEAKDWLCSVMIMTPTQKKKISWGKLPGGQDGNSETIARYGIAVQAECRISCRQKVEAARRGGVLGARGE